MIMHQLAVILIGFLMMTRYLTFGQFTEFFADYKDKNVIDYSFKYSVDDELSGVSMDHWEEKSDNRIIGRYALLEPGGYVRSVYYIVDGESGFRSTTQTRMLVTPYPTRTFQQSSVPYQHHTPIAYV
ncbi:Cuticle protein 19 [Pseudolycoriella hygida]|uniref:Cuticle protein 19 n=1 Tax=Pseudolycoriella hygida TaxID=35572 RepID=A0A9Q0S1N4_9DIPT|nr:Cuticle protein 19 [Pseudolycoriella hygida]